MGKQLSIAIDGPAAAGKSTVAKQVANELGFIYIDTGAMYRALTYFALRESVALTDEQGLYRLLMSLDIQLCNAPSRQEVLINGEVVTDAIRTQSVTQAVSIVSRHKLVREEMSLRQKKLALQGAVVMDGRDIGTEVMPNAEVKIFMTASVEERAKRRHKENLEKGFLSDLEQLIDEIAARDKSDSEREVSPLKKASDAIEVDTSHISIDEVVEEILKIVKEVRSQPKLYPAYQMD